MAARVALSFSAWSFKPLTSPFVVPRASDIGILLLKNNGGSDQRRMFLTTMFVYSAQTGRDEALTNAAGIEDLGRALTGCFACTLAVPEQEYCRADFQTTLRFSTRLHRILCRIELNGSIESSDERVP
jgi:hypothetical protein